MKLILHEMAHSPFCIPVKRILQAYSVPFETNAIPAWDRRQLIALTSGAYYQVPVLESDGQIVHETAEEPVAVARYLNAQFCNGELFPDSCAGLQEIVIEHIENSLEGKGFKLSDPYFVDGIGDIGDRVMVIRHKERSFGPGCVEKWREETPALLREFEASLKPFETRLNHSPFLFGDAPVYADYALFGVLGNFQFGGHHQLNAHFENLVRWEKRLANHTASN
tara:strand:- start:4837 stop:5505 length:669 start_codon:yes stop_codon:yes gene_type:complete